MSHRTLRAKRLAKLEDVVMRMAALAPDAPSDEGVSATLSVKSNVDGSEVILSYDDQTEVGRQLLALERELLVIACRRRVRR